SSSFLASASLLLCMIIILQVDQHPVAGLCPRVLNWAPVFNAKRQWVPGDLGGLKEIQTVQLQGDTALQRNNSNDGKSQAYKFKLGYSLDGKSESVYKEVPNEEKVFTGTWRYDKPVTHKLTDAFLARYVKIIPIEWKTDVGVKFDVNACSITGESKTKNNSTNRLVLEHGNLGKTPSKSHMRKKRSTSTTSRKQRKGRRGGRKHRIKKHNKPPRLGRCSFVGMNLPKNKISASSSANHFSPFMGIANTVRKGGAWIPSPLDQNPWIQMDLSTPMQVIGVILQSSVSGKEFVQTFKFGYSLNGITFNMYKERGNTAKEFLGNTKKRSTKMNMFYPGVTARYVRLYPLEWTDAIALRFDVIACEIKDGSTIGRLSKRHKRLKRSTSKYRSNRREQIDRKRENMDRRKDRRKESRKVKPKSKHKMTKSKKFSKKPSTALDRKNNNEPNLGMCSLVGMKLPKNRITASSSANHFSPYMGIANTIREKGAWIPSQRDRRPWIQIDLSVPMQVIGILLQSSVNGDEFVKTFKFSYSLDNSTFDMYREQNDTVKVFLGNTEKMSTKLNTFYPGVTARYVCLHPLEWNDAIALRFDVLACEIK
ncbi:unnamed protein product, partial [Owenia fusiformis]